ncbi:hypothetical protein BX600DRAFT_513555 [Xylariales sp. PMI_506]|nr:hypothetical protein BX600DRAFT_513555 [Xylariales sp. PMI_506]
MIGRVGSHKPLLLIVSLLVFVGLVTFQYRTWIAPDGAAALSQVTDSWLASGKTSKTSSVFNQTLGFQQVFAIGLPERSDKRDALALMSALTGFKITWLDGVRGKDVADKALPLGWDRKTMHDNNLGSWRGHINAIRTIVEERLGSALIMEDDMDWDSHLKGQLNSFATVAQELQVGWEQDNIPPVENSPYGAQWDMLWFGVCATTFDEDLPEWLAIPQEQRDSRKVFIHDDHTVPPPNHIRGNLSFSWESYPPQTRIVFVPGDNICSYAYALSFSGALKALEYLGLEGQHKPFDNHLSDLCRLRANGMRCIGITPSLFVHHRPKGNSAGDSDIAGLSTGEMREVGFTENILYSTRLNLQNLVAGKEPQKQWAH